MKRIAIIVASNNLFRNTGMFSVDFAAYQFFKSNFPECEITLWCYELSDQSYYPYEHLMPYSVYRKYYSYDKDFFSDSDLIVYWSDFFHTRHFLEEYMEDYVFSKLNKGDSEEVYLYNRKNAEDRFYDLYFLEFFNESIFEKVILFGTSMMFFKETDSRVHDRYSSNLHRVYKNCRAKLHRDFVSMENSKKINDENVYVGCDPAFFIEYYPSIPEDKVGIYLGRRNEIKLSDVFCIIKFAIKNKLKIEWIQWMYSDENFILRSIKHPEQAKNLFFQKLLSIIFRKKKKAMFNDFDNLSSFKMVITDTYHLAVNSINQGTDVFCIGDDSVIYGRSALDLHDKKKEVLFAMQNNLDSYGDLTESKLNKTFEEKDSSTKRMTYYGFAKKKLIKKCEEVLGGS